MTAPALPQPIDVPTEIRRLRERITVLRQQIATLSERNHALRTARNFAASDAAGYIDRTGLEDHR